MRKIVRQHDEKDCGPACLAMIASTFKIDIPLIKCRELLKTDNNGTSAYAMVKGANELGLDAEVYDANIEELEKAISDGEIHCPFVAHILSEEGFLHYVVVFKINKKNVVFGDPARGLVKIKKDKLYEMWTGIIIDYNRNEHFKEFKVKKESTTIIKKFLISQKFIIAFLGIISFFITLIGLINIFFVQQLIDHVNHAEINDSVIQEAHHHTFISDSGKELWINSILSKIEELTHNHINIVIIVLVAFTLQLTLKIIRGRQIAKFTQLFDLQLVQDTYNKSLKLPLEYFETRRTGEIITRFADTAKIRESITKIILTLMNDSVLVLLFGIVLFSINKVYFIGTFSILLSYVLAIILEKEPLKRVNNEILQNNEKSISYITNTFSTISTVKLFNRGGFELRLKSIFFKLTQCIKKGINLHIIIESISSFISSAGAIIVLSLGVNQCIEGKLSIGMLVACYMIAGFLLEPIKNLSNLQEDFQEASVAINRLNDIIMAENEADKQNTLNDKKIRFIEINKLSFGYGYREEILKNINLKVSTGEKIAIVGETGCGKSTLAKLLVGFYNSYNGLIKYNESDIKSLSKNDIRNRVAYLSQGTDIYNDTIENNIIMDRTDITEEDFIAACKIALVDEIIEKLPQGMDTVINENGYDLSQGEKQRIALARAIVGNPEVLVLDEATSNLDYLTEKRILDNINVCYKEKTIIFIAHRLSTVISCDKIAVINDGEIIEQGTHQDLISLNGMYADMYRTQEFNIK